MRVGVWSLTTKYIGVKLLVNQNKERTFKTETERGCGCGVVCIYTTNFLSDILNLLPNFNFELAEIRYAFFSISPPKIVDTHHIIPKSMVVENPLLGSRKSTTVQ